MSTSKSRIILFGKIFLGMHIFVELSVAILMYFALMPEPYTEVFINAHPVVRGFAGGGAAAIGVVGILTLMKLIPMRTGLAFCGVYQLFIAFNEIVHEASLIPWAEATQHFLGGIMPHILLGIWGILCALKTPKISE